MFNPSRTMPWVLRSVAVPAVLFATLAAAQTRPVAPNPNQPGPHARPATAAQPLATPAPLPSDRDVAATQRELIKLLRLSPTLTTVVARDPSLLSNQDYVSRNNPELAAFLTTHPEIARNPEFYLFTHMNAEDGQPDEALERAVWPQFSQPRRNSPNLGDIFAPMAAAVAFACFLAALIWLVRVFLENRRWSRIFKLQSEVHGKLIEKFSSNQDLSLYMDSEAGKRFLEAAPIPVGFQPEEHVPNALSRVFTLLQIGVVLVLVAFGLFGIHHGLATNYDYAQIQTPLMMLNYLTMMAGLGFIISAGVTWVLASRLGLIPENPKTQDKLDSPLTPSDRQ